MSDGTVRRDHILCELDFLANLNGVLFGATVEQSNACIAALITHNDALLTQARELAEALARLSNEVIGSLPLAEGTIRQAIGNTNYNCVMERATEARAVLAKVQAVLKEGH